MNDSSLIVCLQPTSDQWELGKIPAQSGDLILVGWHLSKPCPDAGIPPAVSRIFTQALCSLTRLIFPVSTVRAHKSEGWIAYGENLVYKPPDNRVQARLISLLPGKNETPTLISTRQPETAILLFDDPGYPWWLRSQFILLLQPEYSPPLLDYEKVVQLFGPTWMEQVAGLEKHGILGAVRPGVDGDMAGLFVLDRGFQQQLLTELKIQAERAGLKWLVMEEDEFANNL